MKQLALGILAHVDAGKTTLSEGLLYTAGALRKLGRVDHRDAFLDTNAQEKERGITIFSKQAVLQYGTARFTLLDTPGHVDFSTEMERTLQVMDYAVLVISGTDGVQSHTETLWRLLARHRIPTFLFLNKMDLAGADAQRLLEELKQRLSENCVVFGQAQDTAFAENLALCDEALMEEVLESGAPSQGGIIRAVAARKVFPCYFGSALRLDGIEALLRGLEDYTQAPACAEAFGAKVFKIARDEQGARLTYCKITGGSLPVKTSLAGTTKTGEPWSEKVNQIRIYSGTKYETTEVAECGMVCALTGFSKTYPGEGLGAEPDAEAPVLEPVLTYRAELPAQVSAHTALAQLRALEEEDPQLHIMWNEQLQEIHLQLMGEVQLEVLQRLVAERFGWQVGFGQGSIVYKETIAKTVEGVGHFEPLRHYAEVHLLLEPTALGSGLQLATNCSEEVLDKNWQRLILTHLEEKTHFGVLTGSPITDMKITLAAGRAHLKHTEGGDFRQATYRAVRQGLRQAESILLEPWYDYRLTLPAESLGRAMADMQRKSGTFAPPLQQGEMAVLSGSAPVAELQGYQREVISYTRGRGQLACTLKGYAPCHNAQEVIAAVGYDCDADVENTADSVFCEHGAGFNVRWDEVPAHMHLPSVLAKPVMPQAPVQARPRHTGDSGLGFFDDKELQKIFEQTYGPLKRDPRKSFAPAEQTQGYQRSSAEVRLSGPEYLLVDGYNIIFAWDELSTLAKENLDAARNKLIQMMCNYQGYCKCHLILVFDAYKVKNNPGEVEQVAGISVVYTKEAETADMYIEKVTHELGRKYRVKVATSDGMEQLIILGQGAMRVSAAMFRQEVDRIEAAIREHLGTGR
ncbi:TetM/TetW/TetO/TetS family tetracycline resistance ribosomal protection protein [Pygmaiobacter massiliensis]|uniref:TetM/TetW/TetO/TetS family tetracycline resistance ribosomal protection protein n=1 Tax=Pygmaiobacter massiliensis TaxID=1917873 RepID=UPI0028975A83|nr:TetM/TetW/TetO/TetS family tetracycline resistance ribosomal protection protein [Pygmaiobacter massiliensis]